MNRIDLCPGKQHISRMTPALPPPLPQHRTKTSTMRDRGIAVILISVFVVGIFSFCVLAVLRAAGLLRPFSIPTAGMAPAIEQGDKIVMEGFSYLRRKPQRGDLVVFNTGGIPAIGQNSIYVKRLVGLPGDTLILSNGVLTVNGKPMSFHNKRGEIQYSSTSHERFLKPEDTVTVPDESYFVLGDSAKNADSRWFGFVPVRSVLGRAAFCYWPPAHFGAIN